MSEMMLWFLVGLVVGLALDWVLVKIMLRSVNTRLMALEVNQRRQDVVCKCN